MPIAAIISKRIFCAYGGPPKITTLNEISSIPRPLSNIPDTGVVYDLLFGDYMTYAAFDMNDVQTFCHTFDFEYFFHAKYVKQGYRIIDNKLVTIITVPNYVRENDSKGAIVEIDTNLSINFTIIS
jgi:serine/threonine-protein phosphatase PP1 catalytic subunit